MKVKLKELLAAATTSRSGRSPLEAYADLQVSPVSKAMRRLAALEQIDREIARFRNLNTKLVKKYGKTGDSGVLGVSPTDENYPAFFKELTDLLEFEVDIDGLEKVFISTFSAVSPKELAALRFLVIDFPTPPTQIEEQS